MHTDNKVTKKDINQLQDLKKIYLTMLFYHKSNRLLVLYHDLMIGKGLSDNAVRTYILFLRQWLDGEVFITKSSAQKAITENALKIKEQYKQEYGRIFLDTGQNRLRATINELCAAELIVRDSFARDVTKRPSGKSAKTKLKAKQKTYQPEYIPTWIEYLNDIPKYDYMEIFSLLGNLYAGKAIGEFMPFDLDFIEHVDKFNKIYSECDPVQTRKQVEQLFMEMQVNKEDLLSLFTTSQIQKHLQKRKDNTKKIASEEDIDHVESYDAANSLTRFGSLPKIYSQYSYFRRNWTAVIKDE